MVTVVEIVFITLCASPLVVAAVAGAARLADQIRHHRGP